MTIRTGLVALAEGLALAVAPVPSAAAAGPQACVEGPTPQCYPTVQQALDAAPAGGTVRLGVGTFAGGVVITRDVRVVGAGSDRTSIAGGGPVVLVRSAKNGRPLVKISSLTITGGVTHGDSKTSDTFNAVGGGLMVTPAKGGGAAVHLRHVVVSGNQTVPTETSDSPSGVKCPHGFCPYAGSYGGGIASFGDLFLADTQVVGNSAGGRASDAAGGGIFSAGGSLVVKGSVVADNRAAPLEIGRYAEGAGITVTDGSSLVIRNSKVQRNTAELITSWPVRAQGKLLDMNVNSGGIHVGDGSTLVVSGVRMTDNVVRAVDPKGEPIALAGAMLVGDSRLLMSRTVIADNVVEARTKSSEHAGASGGALELHGPGTITSSRIMGNLARTVTERGVAGAGSGLAVYDFSDNPRQVLVRNSVIAGNVAHAKSARGTAVAQGGGVMNNSLLRLVGVVVRDNRAEADAPRTLAQGGGIWNGPLLSGPPVVLDLRTVRVVDNSVAGAHGPRQGGGIYTTERLDLHGTTLAGNRPDGCSGC